MNPQADPPPTAHEDDESEVPAVGVAAPGAPDAELVDAPVPHLSGKRADEHDAYMEDDETPPPRGD